MKSIRYFALALLLVGGCKSTPDDGYAIDFRITFDSSVSDAALAQVTTLHLDVSGAETFSTDVSTSGKLMGRSGGLRYKPGAKSGMLDFAFVAKDGAGMRVASGAATVTLKSGTQVIDVGLSYSGNGDGGAPSDGAVRGDGGSPMDMALCGNGKVDPGESCDPGAGSPTPCPKSVADCDDHNDCTTDTFSGSACTAACAHAPLTDGVACGAVGDGGTSGLCQSGACCKGCVVGGACVAGTSDAKKCGSGGNACIDCSQFSASATCNSGVCSGCDATSCTNEGRLCGLSSCGYNCGTCADSCANGGTLTHYTCVNKACAPVNPPANCGLFASCASANACKTQCTGDNDCLGTAFCDTGSKTCKPKSGLGGPCSAETTGDHECASPYVCSWGPSGTSGYCVTARCTGCAAATTSGNCFGFITNGLDPRSACQGYAATACHQNYCRGTYDGDQGDPSCDIGEDTYGNPRPCGAITCTNTPGGTGTFKGYACTISSGCQPSQTVLCSYNGAFTACYACNASGCDYTKGNMCE